jgi:hypothetical protein
LNKGLLKIRSGPLKRRSAARAPVTVRHAAATPASRRRESFISIPWEVLEWLPFWLSRAREDSRLADFLTGCG